MLKLITAILNFIATLLGRTKDTAQVVEPTRVIRKAVVHCTATDDPKQWNISAVRFLHTSPKTQPILWGNYETTGNDWRDTGYHALSKRDGEIERGRPDHEMGAGVYGHNRDSLHLALHGNSHFEEAQLKGAFYQLHVWEQTYGELEIVGHCELDSKKSCPNFDMDLFRMKYHNYKQELDKKENDA